MHTHTHTHTHTHKYTHTHTHMPAGAHALAHAHTHTACTHTLGVILRMEALFFCSVVYSTLHSLPRLPAPGCRYMCVCVCACVCVTTCVCVCVCPVRSPQVYSADEAFVTGTFAGQIPVVSVDGRTIGSGGRGPLVQRLQQLYR